MGDTGLGRHRRSSGVTSERCYSHYGGVLFRRRKAAPGVCLNPAKHEQPTCMATFFRFTATWDTEKRARQWVSIYANREKLAPPFHRRMGCKQRAIRTGKTLGAAVDRYRFLLRTHTKRERIIGLFILGFICWISFFRHWEGVTPFIFDGYQYLFLFFFFTVPVFSPEGLGGADWWPSPGWEDGSRGLSHGMETGKGGKGRGVCFSPWVIPREPG